MAAANNPPVEKKKEIVVLGAGEHLFHCVIVLATSLSVDASGVVGLTAALKIQLHGNYRVTVISEIIPSDPKSIKYTSRWAVGCIRLLIPMLN
jgi:hypothetical protein